MSKLPINEDILPPHNDYIMKALFTHPEAKPALIDLVASIIGREVIDVQVLNNELPVMDVNEKNERLDINCITADKTQVNIEMQGSRMEEPEREEHNNFFSKYTYYLCDLHSSQPSKGRRYFELAQTYQVTFSTYTVLPDREGYITKSNLRSEDGALITDSINMVIIELSKLENVLKKSVDEMTSLEMWSVFLGFASDSKKRQLINDIIERKEAIGMASSVLTSISKDDHERAKFRSRRKFESDYDSDMLTAEARGMEKGREEGMEKGREEGMEKGREEVKLEVAIKLKLLGLSIEQIAQATSLSPAEIEKL